MPWSRFRPSLPPPCWGDICTMQLDWPAGQDLWPKTLLVGIPGAVPHNAGSVPLPVGNVPPSPLRRMEAHPMQKILDAILADELDAIGSLPVPDSYRAV